jgi:hypothetical protein
MKVTKTGITPIIEEEEVVMDSVLYRCECLLLYFCKYKNFFSDIGNLPV